MSKAPARKVALPALEDFGTGVPVLMVEDDDGNVIDAVAGSDIGPFVDWLLKNGTEARATT